MTTAAIAAPTATVTPTRTGSTATGMPTNAPYSFTTKETQL